MAKTAYKISSKGYVGGADFVRTTVDRELSKNDGKQVSVLIDSLVADFSISVAFNNHGNVNVYFAGLNASVVTITSLGAAPISIVAGECASNIMFDGFLWVGSLNSNQISSFIADCEKIKATHEKLDFNCAQLYAKRCKHKTGDLLALMKVVG